MPGELTNHLWQSTIFVFVAGFIALLLRQNRAQVRYWVWLSASCKFLVPLSLLIGLGSQFQRVPVNPGTGTAKAVQFTLVQISQPFPTAAPLAPTIRATHNWTALIILGTWACGFAAIIALHFSRI